MRYYKFYFNCQANLFFNFFKKDGYLAYQKFECP